MYATYHRNFLGNLRDIPYENGLDMGHETYSIWSYNQIRMAASNPPVLVPSEEEL
jgi:hypothetical protein